MTAVHDTLVTNDLLLGSRMVVVLRQSGLRVILFRDDHAPPDVHVFGDGEARIGLGASGGMPTLVSADGLDRDG